MSNKALWERVCKTDPKHVKPITGKDYGGNSPKPYWIVERLTEEFGPCGIGWGYSIEGERFERFSDTDVLHIAKVRLWYDMAGKRGEVEQMGQTKASYWTSGGKLKVDEDAPKKSVTDALVKCASYLGFAGDIFSGRWDDSKYVNDLRKEFAEKADDEQQKPAPRGRAAVIKPTEGAGQGISNDRKAELDEMALFMVESHQGGDDMAAIKLWYDKNNGLDNEERVYLWEQLRAESKLRASIKANQPTKEAA